jgi:predicted nucleotidyltransferase
MNITDKKLTQNQKDMLNKISIYIDKPIYLYGSIHRSDYIPGKSDIDIDIFTENEQSTINILSNLFNFNKTYFKKTIYKINSCMVFGYKTKYLDEINGINFEISIYNEKYKNIILYEHNNSRFLPFYITFILCIIKILFYDFKLISKKNYQRCKRFLMNPDDELKFIVVDT